MTKDSIEYDSVNFTLPIALIQQLNELAEEHSDGNVSQFLRSAIRDHARTLDGQDEFEFKRLRQEVERIGARIDDLAEIVEDITQAQSIEPDTESIKSEKDNISDAAIQRHVHSCLLESRDEAVSLDKLASEIDAESLAIQRAVESLLEKEFIQKRTDDELVRYQIRSP